MSPTIRCRLTSVVPNDIATEGEPSHGKLKSKLKYQLDPNNNISNSAPNIYDSLCPKDENILMQYIRKWERRIGFVTPLIWSNIFFIVAYHIVATGWGVYALAVRTPKWQTVIFGLFTGMLTGFGVTAGVHRYWCHKSYKAKRPLQLILLVCYSMAGQNSIFNWVRDHRVHHKFSETAADPHDAHRGFFFSHVGWLMMKKHPAVLAEGAKLDMTDITNDPLIAFHTKYFQLFKLFFCFVLPTLVPTMCWNETWEYSIVSQLLLRYMFSLNATWAVNSFAHLWGNKPYDKNIMPSENWMVSIIAMGEGWHNYHHTFPWDYKAAELPYTINLTTLLLDCFACIGWAYDLKVTSPALVKAVIENRGPQPQSFQHRR